MDEDESAHDQDRDWYEYWRKCFPKISVEDIEKFSADYKNSDEEKKDLIKLDNIPRLRDLMWMEVSTACYCFCNDAFYIYYTVWH